MKCAEKFGNVWYAAAILLLGALAASAQPLASDHQPPRKAKPKQVAAAAALPEPVRLRVSCEGGLLSISAQDAWLRDILQQLRQCTGTVIDLPPDADERIAVQLGPAPALQVVIALLDGTQFNYLISGNADDPGAVRTIQLMLKPSTPAPPVPVSVAEIEARPSTDADIKATLTGGDEGGSDQVEIGIPNAPPPQPAEPK
jgi:hypothetical protein